MTRPSRIVTPLAAAVLAVAACHRRAPQTEVRTSSTTTTRVDTSVVTRTDEEALRRAEEERRRRAEAERADAASRSAAVRNILAEKVFFDFDSEALSNEARAVLDRKLTILQANPALRIRIEGNTDSRGSDEYNLALGQRRAVTAKRYLTDRGIDPSRIDVVSFGEERPVAEGENEAAWAQNRRDEFVVVAGGDRLVPPR